VKGHGVPLGLLKRLERQATKWFDTATPNRKLQLQAPFGLGYMGQGKENVSKTLLDSVAEESEGAEEQGTTGAVTPPTTSAPVVMDYKESLNLTLPVRDGVWPSSDEDGDESSLRRVGEEYYGRMLTLASQMMRLFAMALELPENFFDDKVDEPYTTLRLLNYPPRLRNAEGGGSASGNGENDGDDEKKDARGGSNGDEDSTAATTKRLISEHTDYGTMTILWSPDSRGLQAKTRNGTWVDVVLPPLHDDNSDDDVDVDDDDDRDDGECYFVINIGDLMMNWTNDEWVSTLHRVVQHPSSEGKRRFSVPFFHNPNPDAVVECCVAVAPGTEPKYEPILAKRHLEMKVSKALGTEERLHPGDEE